jgi:SAM-dependent methyltransferase
MELPDIIRCPKTGNKLQFNNDNSTLYVKGTDVTYPVIDGIVDFCGDKNDRISASYDRIAFHYDAYITSSNVLMKVCDTFVWGIPDDSTYVDTVLSYLPSQFNGILLDVPVGAGVFTCSLYARFPNATIIGIDSSMGMLQKAKNCFHQQGLSNIHLLRANVAKLPIRDSAVDILLSMNGLHVFADKQRAIAEMRRVIHKNGTLIACCYVRGVRRLSDWFVKHFGIRHGYFNPPFLQLESIASNFEGFTMRRQGNIKSLVYFEAVKKEEKTER